VRDRTSWLLLFLTLFLLLSGTANAGPACEEDDVAFEVVLLQSFPFSFDAPRDFVIRNERQWCTFWRQVHLNLDPAPACDRAAIDFRHELVIASTTGSGPNGCYGVDIPEIKRIRGRGIRVFVNERIPGPDCLCTLSFVSPIQAVVVSEPVERVEFVHEETVLDCSR